MSSLPEKGKSRRSKKATTKAPTSLATEPPPPTKEQTAAMARALMVRKFATALLQANFNASKALRTIRPDVSQKSSKTLASELLQCADVQDEVLRQLRGLSSHADMNEAWLYAQWRAMANSNIFDYVDVDADGNVTVTLSREHLTLEQQLNVRRLRFDKTTGRVVDLELIDRKGAVDSVAKAQGLFRELEESAMADIAKEITERMQAASKRVPRTFDGKTGEEID